VQYPIYDVTYVVRPLQSSGAIWRFCSGLHQENIDHGGFVDDQQIAIEQVVVVALEPAPAMGSKPFEARQVSGEGSTYRPEDWRSPHMLDVGHLGKHWM
jgi:hypothetical protein